MSGLAFLGVTQLVVMAWAWLATRTALAQMRRAERAEEDLEAARKGDAAYFWRLCAKAQREGRDYRVDPRAQAAYRLHIGTHYKTWLN